MQTHSRSRRHIVPMLAGVLFISVSIGNAVGSETTTHPVCAKSDFLQFVASYAQLSATEQLSCVRFPLSVEENEYDTAQKLQASSFGERKIILAKEDLEKKGLAVGTPFFFPLPDDASTPYQLDEYGYIITKSDGEMRAVLSSGGTFSYESTFFLWANNEWQVVAITSDEEGASDEEGE